MPDPAERNSFSSLLRQHRLAAGLTQAALAERAGLAQRTIEDLERGVSRPRRETARRLVAALAIPPGARVWIDEATMAPRHSGRRSPHDVGGQAPLGQRRADDLAPLTTATHCRNARRPAPVARFVGRERELALLARHLTSDGPPMLLLAGEPGLGKTRLLAEATRDAKRRGWCVLEGGCQRRGSQEPFAPLLGALADFPRGRAPAELRGDLRGCAWLVRLLPELAGTIGEPLPGWVIAPEQERRLIFAAVARLLTNLAQRRATSVDAGLLLVLDDLQWAGSDALDLLAALVRPDAIIATGPLRVVGAYRDSEVQPHDVLGVALADWAHAGQVIHHTLPPLAPEECGHLLDELLADTASRAASTEGYGATRERVLQRAGGVPFFIVSYAQALRRGDVGGGAAGVPWDAAQGVRQRVAALPEPARALLSAAAVIGRVSDPQLLMAVTGRSEEAILAGLEAANQARLLLDAGRTYHFAHDVVREVVEGDLSSARRAILHRHTAAAIEGLHAERLADQYETLADHYLRGEAWEQALEYLKRSGDKAVAAGAIREALNYYEQALAVCATLGDAAEVTAAAVAEKRAFVCFESADFVGALADFDRMHAAATQLGDGRLQGMALAYGGMSAYYGHDFPAAERLLRGALVLAGTTFEDVRLFASIQLSSLLMVTDRHAEAQPLIRMVEELAPRIDDPLSRAWWAITGSEVLHWSGRYGDALALIEGWQGAVMASNQLLVLLWTTWESALACGGNGEYARALALLDEVMALCGSVDETFIRARALNTLGWIYGELQDHERALDLNGQSLALAGTIETVDTEIGSNARLNLGDSLAALGRLAEAEEHFKAVERVVRAPRPQDHWMLWRYAQHLFHSYGELWLARGDLGKALTYTDECLRGAETSDSKKNVVKARRLRGQVFLAQGDLHAAEAEFDSALAMARRIGNPPQLWKTLTAVGDLRHAQDAHAGAQHAYREALAVVDAVAARLHDASLRETLLASPHIQGIRRAATSYPC